MRDVALYRGRPSELLEITPSRVGLSGGTVTIRSLKKRKVMGDNNLGRTTRLTLYSKDTAGASKIIYRSVPVPPDCLAR